MRVPLEVDSWRSFDGRWVVQVADYQMSVERAKELVQLIQREIARAEKDEDDHSA